MDLTKKLPEQGSLAKLQDIKFIYKTELYFYPNNKQLYVEIFKTTTYNNTKNI